MSDEQYVPREGRELAPGLQEDPYEASEQTALTEVDAAVAAAIAADESGPPPAFPDQPRDAWAPSTPEHEGAETA